MGGRKRGEALLVVVLAAAVAGCGSKKQPPTDADKGSEAATRAVEAEAVRAWLDPDGTKDYDDSAVVVVRNTSDKLAGGVTVKLKWPQGYETRQDEAIAVEAGERGVFVLGPFDAPPDVKGQPKAEVRVDGLQTGPADTLVEFDDFKLSDAESGCELTGTTSNRFENEHPGVSGLVAGFKDGEIVTGGSVFFEEPGLQPGKDGTFTATLEPLCPDGEVDEWVGYAQLTTKDFEKP